MKYLILGNGWLGNSIKEYVGNDGTISQRRLQKIEIDDILGYNVVINTAAKTNIEWCENNRFEAYDTNTIHASRIALLCREIGVKYVFISTACVLQSKDESDIKDESSTSEPSCYYSLTKVLAEQLIALKNPDSLIARSRLLFGKGYCGRNLIDKLSFYKEISSQPESMTCIDDFVPELINAIGRGESGIVHFINEGTVSPADIATEMGYTFKPVSKEELNTILAQKGMLPRVTVYATSKRTRLLPPITQSINTIKEFRGVLIYK